MTEVSRVPIVGCLGIFLVPAGANIVEIGNHLPASDCLASLELPASSQRHSGITQRAKGQKEPAKTLARLGAEVLDQGKPVVVLPFDGIEI